MMRFFVGTLLAGVVIGLLLPQMPLFLAIGRTAPIVPYVLIALVAFVCGAEVIHSGWIAAAAAYVIGHAMWISFYLRPSPPWAPSDNGTWIGFALGQVLVSAIICAGFGALGSWTARFVLRIARPN